ncbi:major facilitator superfamily transporter [Apodospora peruviana]|uniref:Molybdate-anion transporter n=1 Tax=Apodospora peruviana TaxID=516989 RepID=A0AAE0M222_9PEZI|nr:major facilitator superfamily transporter [Apodospora peruviana]
MVDIYTLNLGGLLALCGALFVAQSRSNASKKDNTKTKKKPQVKNESSKSQLPFLLIYALVMGADWLQGPFLYSLYHDEYHLSHTLISTLFTTGFCSGAVSGAFIGSLADKHGRKAACLFFCVAYSLSCLFTILPPPGSSPVLLFTARALGGLSTSLLFSVFESWMVADFYARGLDKNGRSLSSTFGTMSTLNSLVAIGSGVGSEWLVAAAGTRKAPFVASTVLLGVAFVGIWLSWDEYYGESNTTNTSSNKKTNQEQTKDKSTLVKILTNPKIFSLGLASTIFEGSMYLFVFFWTPALRSTQQSPETDLPYGVIFASFMASCLASSLAFNTVLSNAVTQSTLLLLILGTSAFCFFLSATPASEQAAFWVFCLFEAAVGVYWPCMGTLKGNLIDDGIRAQVYGMLRVPLNVFVVVSLLVTGEGAAAYGRVFMACGMMLAGASGVLWVVGL